jgi:hypothetical protein
MGDAMDEDAPRVSDDERSEDEDRRPGGRRNLEKSKSRSRSRSREREPEKVRVDSGDGRCGAMRARSASAIETSTRLARSRDRGRPPRREALPAAPSTAKRQT